MIQQCIICEEAEEKVMTMAEAEGCECEQVIIIYNACRWFVRAVPARCETRV